MKLMKGRVDGLTLAELLVLLAMYAIILALLLPQMAKPGRRKSPGLQCVRNLKEVGLAFRIFATDHQDRFPMQVSTNEGGSMEFVKDGNSFRHLAALSNQFNQNPRFIACPADKKRKPAVSFALVEPGNVSYFVGLDSTELQPQTFLAGDRNLTTNGRAIGPGLIDLTTNAVVGWTTEMHDLQGNVAMGDGSVQQFSASRLADALRRTGMATNKLAVP